MQTALESAKSENLIKRTAVVLIAGAWMFNVLMHVPSFDRTRFTGDELVYQVLAKEMTWDLAKFSTAGDPNISRWGVSIYRQPLFHHGPVLPYVIKLGGLVDQPVVAAFVFANVVVALYFSHLLLLYSRFAIPWEWRTTGFFMAAFAPLILFSTTRIHHDATCGMLIACGLIAYIEALERRSLAWTVWSGLLFVLALNLRFTALIGVPLIFVIQSYHIYRVRFTQRLAPMPQPAVPGTRYGSYRLGLFSVIVLIVVTLGLQHFYRLYLTYGTIFPWEIMQQDPNSAWVQFIASRTRLKNAINLILLIPALILLLLPSTCRLCVHGLKARDWGPVFVVSSFFMLAVLLGFSYREIRFFAVGTPLFYCGLPWILANSKRARLPVNALVVAFSLVVMIAAGYRETVVRPNEVFRIVPVLYELIPSLIRFW